MPPNTTQPILLSMLMTAPMLELEYRLVSLSDAYPLWVWANDIHTRAMSGGRQPIPWTEHMAFLTAATANRKHWIVRDHDTEQPLGTVRLDTGNAWDSAELSYCVAPESRGRHIGSQMVQYVMDTHPEVALYAAVRAGNTASIKIFDRLGWVCRGAPIETAGQLLYRWLKGDR